MRNEFSPSAKGRDARRDRGRFPLQVECLEDRLALSGSPGLGGLHTSPAIVSPPTGQVAQPSPIGPLLPAVPAHNSLPGASASLYLDFDGHYQQDWGGYHNLSTPVFDLDGNPASFSAAEEAAIKEIWQRVSEDYAPFQINVTTVKPGDFSNGKALRVAIGGSSNDWLGNAAGGVSYVGSFTDSVPNVAYVFPKELANTAKYIADAASHEAGHAFGLQHQSVYNSSGVKTEEYNPGTPSKAPIMGVSYSAERSTWWLGPNKISASTTQDDMAVLAGAANGFGYRSDDHPTVTPLVAGTYGLGETGIIETTSDSDHFSFSTTGGTVSFTVLVAPTGANLDAKAELWGKKKLNIGSGSSVYIPYLIASSDPADSLNATVSADLAMGSYTLVVKSHGEYGDVGKYTILGAAPGSSMTALPVFTAPSPGGEAGSAPAPSGAPAAGSPVALGDGHVYPAAPRLSAQAVDVVLAARTERATDSAFALDWSVF
jgi:hypothetical protein